MRTSRHGLALAGLATVTALGATSFADEAEAKDKLRHKRGFTVIIGDGYPGFGYGYRSYGCGWLLDRYHETGSSKWYSRWHRCKYGW